jgi:hypothetical protein
MVTGIMEDERLYGVGERGSMHSLYLSSIVLTSYRQKKENEMGTLISADLLAALGSEDAEFAIEEYASRHEESLAHAEQILEDIVINWVNTHRRFPEPLTVDSLLSEAEEQ